jgi:hypothetical protein
MKNWKGISVLDPSPAPKRALAQARPANPGARSPVSRCQFLLGKVEQVIHSQASRHAAVTRTRYMRERLRKRPPHIFVVKSSVRVRHVTGGSGRIRPAAGAAFLLRFQPDALPRAEIAAD